MILRLSVCVHKDGSMSLGVGGWENKFLGNRGFLEWNALSNSATEMR